MKTEQGRIMRVDIYWPILGNGSKLMNWSQIIKEEYDSYNLHTLWLAKHTINIKSRPKLDTISQSINWIHHGGKCLILTKKAELWDDGKKVLLITQLVNISDNRCWVTALYYRTGAALFTVCVYFIVLEQILHTINWQKVRSILFILLQ